MEPFRQKKDLSDVRGGFSRAEILTIFFFDKGSSFNIRSSHTFTYTHIFLHTFTYTRTHIFFNTFEYIYKLTNWSLIFEDTVKPACCIQRQPSGLKI